MCYVGNLGTLVYPYELCGASYSSVPYISGQWVFLAICEWIQDNSQHGTVQALQNPYASNTFV